MKINLLLLLLSSSLSFGEPLQKNNPLLEFSYSSAISKNITLASSIRLEEIVLRPSVAKAIENNDLPALAEMLKSNDSGQQLEAVIGMGKLQMHKVEAQKILENFLGAPFSAKTSMGIDQLLRDQLKPAATDSLKKLQFQKMEN